MKDGGLSLGFATNELKSEEKIMASEFHQKFGWLLFKESEFSDADIPDTDAPDETKTPSQRLRAALYVLWKSRGSNGDFQDFYTKNLEQAIERVKRLLD